VADENEKRDDLDAIRIVMDLPRLGELIAHIASAFAQIRGLEPPDFDGDEMRELAVSGWQYCVHMHDRADFARSVERDLAALNDVPIDPAPEEPGPEHRPEFGGAAPLGWQPPLI
jgi:hypothetical protein